jgi:hypothetical protein
LKCAAEIDRDPGAEAADQTEGQYHHDAFARVPDDADARLDAGRRGGVPDPGLREVEALIGTDRRLVLQGLPLRFDRIEIGGSSQEQRARLEILAAGLRGRPWNLNLHAAPKLGAGARRLGLAEARNQIRHLPGPAHCPRYIMLETGHSRRHPGLAPRLRGTICNVPRCTGRCTERAVIGKASPPARLTSVPRRSSLTKGANHV